MAKRMVQNDFDYCFVHGFQTEFAASIDDDDGVSKQREFGVAKLTNSTCFTSFRVGSMSNW